MMRKHAALPAILGVLLIFPSGALADRSGGDHRGTHGGADVRVHSCGSTDVDVRDFTVGPDGQPGVRVTATPDDNRPLGPLDISVNAQVAVLQVVLKTNDVAVLDGVNVGITQGNGPAAAGGDPSVTGGNPSAGAQTPPGGAPAAAANPSGINITVNAQVAVIQVVVGTGNVIVLRDVNVNINQGNQVPAGT
jgi:hypothetical protein